MILCPFRKINLDNEFYRPIEEGSNFPKPRIRVYFSVIEKYFLLERNPTEPYNTEVDKDKGNAISSVVCHLIVSRTEDS